MEEKQCKHENVKVRYDDPTCGGLDSFVCLDCGMVY